MSETPPEAKQPFVIGEALERVREAIAPYPKAAMFELREKGHTSVFAQLVGCMLSIRCRDEVVMPVALRLLAAAPDPQAMVALGAGRILEIISPVTFAGQKAPRILALAEKTLADYGGEIPCTIEAATSFTGIGPKCAHLALGIACGLPYISVDIHVHRITNRWGYVDTRTPEKTLAALEQVLPRPHWIEINSLLVPFGKHVCTGKAPKCSRCPLEPICRQVGVTEHR